MRILLAAICGFLLDLLLGDPPWLYHPVRLIGHLITFAERGLRKVAGNSEQGLIAAGIALWVIVTAVTCGSVCLILYLANMLHPMAAFGLEIFWCYQLLALRSLKQESMKVYHELTRGNLPGARYAVSMIVGRDTENLSEEGVTKATVETVAENTADGVIAPLFYMLIGGVPLAFFYKAVNTMDSMVGYKNFRYFYFGRAAAKMDDVFNYVPARISAILMIVAAFLAKMDGRQAWRIYLRDHKNHASPNSAQTEAVCAGALGIQLAGNAYYFGKLYEKPTIGDAARPIGQKDIVLACKLMDITAVLMVVMGTAIYCLFLCR